jgi:hypothetical protein
MTSAASSCCMSSCRCCTCARCYKKLLRKGCTHIFEQSVQVAGIDVILHLQHHVAHVFQLLPQPPHPILPHTGSCNRLAALASCPNLVFEQLLLRFVKLPCLKICKEESV